MIQVSRHRTLENTPSRNPGFPPYLSHVSFQLNCFVGSLREETWFSWVVIATGTPQHQKRHLKGPLHSVHQYLGAHAHLHFLLFICKTQWFSEMTPEPLSISS